MGLRINTNVQSLAAQNALSRTSTKLNQSLTRLSTGLRVNTGKDDVVALAQSEQLRSKIRGIDVAVSNIAYANSLFGVAEGFLNQLTEISQSMREVTVQGADASISSSDRTALTDKFTSLLNEYNRLASGANFGGQRLLDGTFTSKSLQVGPDEGNTISVSLVDARSSTIGQVAIRTGNTGLNQSTVATSTALAFTTDGFTIGSTSVSTFSTDGVSNIEASESALAFVNAINAQSGSTGVTATVLANVVTICYGTGGLSSNQSLIINGITAKSDTLLVSAGDATDAATLVDKINAVATTTGVTATIDATAQTITLSATDGRNIHIQTTSQTDTTMFGFFGTNQSYANSVYRGTFKLTATSAFNVTGATAEFTNAPTTSVAISSTTSLSNSSVSSVANASAAISILDNAISQLQSRRATVGSTSNRLDIAEAELNSRKENLSAAESRIRDADIAAETAKLTQYQILQQAGATVLAQANSAPQIALTLLQNI